MTVEGAAVLLVTHSGVAVPALHTCLLRGRGHGKCHIPVGEDCGCIEVGVKLMPHTVFAEGCMLLENAIVLKPNCATVLLSVTYHRTA